MTKPQEVAQAATIEERSAPKDLLECCADCYIVRLHTRHGKQDKNSATGAAIRIPCRVCGCVDFYPLD